jgi:hypothetical protein
MLFKRTRRKRRAVFAGFAAILGFGTTFGAVGGALGGVLGSTPAGATVACKVGVGVSIGKTIYLGNTTTKATKQAVARVGDKIIYNVTVDTTSLECQLFTGTLKITFPNGTTQTLATKTLTVTPGTTKSFTATAYIVTNTNIGHQVGTTPTTPGDIQAFATVRGKETHTTITTPTHATANFQFPVIHPETTLTKSVTRETPGTGTVPTTVKYKFTEENHPLGTGATGNGDPVNTQFKSFDSLHTVKITDSGTGCPTATISFTSSTTSTHSTPNKTAPTNKLLPGVTWTFTCTKTFTTVGTKKDTASSSPIAGDTRVAGTSASKGAPHSETATLTVKISPATPTLTTKASANPSVVPGKIKDTVTISGGDKPKGSVVVKVFKTTATCAGTAFATRKVTFTTDGTFATTTITAPTAGTYYFEITAATSTVTSNNKATTLKSACAHVTETAKVGPATPTLSTKASSSGAAGTGTIKDTVTIAGGDKPKGSVVVKVFKTTATCAGTAFATRKVTFTTDGTFATTTISAPTVGTYYFEITASTSTVTSNNKATTLKSVCGHATETAKIGPVTPTLSTKASHTGTAGTGKIKDTVTISGGDNPTGHVVVLVFKTTATCSGTAFASKTVTFKGDGTYSTGTITANTVGIYRFEINSATSVVTANNTKTTLQSACGHATETTRITPVSPTLSTKASSSGAAGSGNVKDVVTISGGYNPTGHVVVKVFKTTATCSLGTFATKTVNFKGDGTYSTGTIAANTAGTYYFEIIVTTSTVTTNNKVTGLQSPCGHATETAKITPVKPTLSTKASATVATEPGGKIKDTVTISGGDNPTGHVVVLVFKTTATCSGTAFASKTVTFAGDGLVSTGTITAPTAGTYRFEIKATTSVVTGNNKATTLMSPCGAAGETAVTRVPGVQTLTPGYWKTHPGTLTNHKCVSGPPHPTTPCTIGELPLKLGNYTVSTFAQAFAVLSHLTCKTTGINCLAGQLLATELNLGHGTNKCIMTVVNQANALLIAVGYTGPGTYKDTKAQAALAKTLANKLSIYNSDNNGTCTALGI